MGENTVEKTLPVEMMDEEAAHESGELSKEQRLRGELNIWIIVSAGLVACSVLMLLLMACTIHVFNEPDMQILVSPFADFSAEDYSIAVPCLWPAATEPLAGAYRCNSSSTPEERYCPEGYECTNDLTVPYAWCLANQLSCQAASGPPTECELVMNELPVFNQYARLLPIDTIGWPVSILVVLVMMACIATAWLVYIRVKKVEVKPEHTRVVYLLVGLMVLATCAVLLCFFFGMTIDDADTLSDITCVDNQTKEVLNRAVNWSVATMVVPEGFLLILVFELLIAGVISCKNVIHK